MDSDKRYRLLKTVAIVLTLAWIGWSVYDGFGRDASPAVQAYAAANRFFDDGRYQEAIESYGKALELAPDMIDARRGQARSLIQLGKLRQARAIYDEVIEKDPAFAGAWANRGIVHDRLGEYRQAVADYEKAIELDERVTEGPGWLTRLLRNQTRRPSTFRDRARYLKSELAKPEGERVLRMPALDDAQRPFRK